MKSEPRRRNPLWKLLGWGVVAVAVLYGLSQRVAGTPPMGTLLDPWQGLYYTARQAEHPAQAELRLPELEAAVTVLRDERGVPHIFADSDYDALMAMGYVVAQDRLFQMDFLTRVASGRLAEVFGPGLVRADRFLRETGMEWGARKNVARVQQKGGIERDLVAWFGSGVNAYIDRLGDEDLPFEFRLLGYRPERYSLLQAQRLLQYMTYDLTYRTDDADYATLRSKLDASAYRKLYPRFAELFVPIVPEPGGTESAEAGRPVFSLDVSDVLQQRAAFQQSLRGTPMEGYRHGKGSNNWAVSSARSTTEAPILAGDMHLSLTLPSIWYEVHLVTPTMNVYGVTIPGAPVLVEAFNEQVGWTFTNTGADVIDHYALELNEDRTRYRYEGGFRELEVVLDTIRVRGADPVIDTLRYAHWGPVTIGEQGAIATQWVAHKPSRTLRALWHMNHAQSYDDFQEALRFWDTPMQNILYADAHGNIAIRSTGYLPIRKAGHGMGVLDGSADAFAWTGRVPFDELPHSYNPPRGFLTSTNQQPTDSTYAYYLGHDWRDAYRSLRIDTLLRRKEQHSVEDLASYQADVHAVQRDLFVPLLDTLSGLSPRADTLRQMLVRWTGDATVDRPEPLVLDEVLRALHRVVWDEEVFREGPRPNETRLYLLLRDEPRSRWLDVQATDAREQASAVWRLALDATADTLAQRYGWSADRWRWGDHHKILFQHVTQSGALRALGRGPVEYPGFAKTLSPAGGRPTTKSASWRMVVDFSQTPPRGYGIYPGGQSGHPFNPLYDLHLPSYVAFEHYELLKPATPDEIEQARVSSDMTLVPD